MKKLTGYSILFLVPVCASLAFAYSLEGIDGAILMAKMVVLIILILMLIAFGIYLTIDND